MPKHSIARLGVRVSSGYCLSIARALFLGGFIMDLKVELVPLKEDDCEHFRSNW